MSVVYQAPEARSLSVEEWHKLAKAGIALPVKITLDGDSMSPLIRRGRDHVTIVPLARALKRGDIVLFIRGDGRYVVHRVYRVSDARVQTFGDHCGWPDGSLPYGAVLGLVVKVERGRLKLNVDCASARLCGVAWMAVRPIRRYYAMGRSFAGKCYHRLIRG